MDLFHTSLDATTLSPEEDGTKEQHEETSLAVHGADRSHDECRRKNGK